MRCLSWVVVGKGRALKLFFWISNSLSIFKTYNTCFYPCTKSPWNVILMIISVPQTEFRILFVYAPCMDKILSFELYWIRNNSHQHSATHFTFCMPSYFMFFAKTWLKHYKVALNYVKLKNPLSFQTIFPKSGPPHMKWLIIIFCKSVDCNIKDIYPKRILNSTFVKYRFPIYNIFLSFQIIWKCCR